MTGDIVAPPLLVRQADRPTAPIRIVHIGLGAFHKAHQAWYTDVVDARSEWGIAAFTGRSPLAAETLAAQGGAYTVIERGPEHDTARVVSSIVEANDGADLERLTQLLAIPSTAVVTLTVTEAGYRLSADGTPVLSDPALRADLDALRDGHRDLVTPLCRIIEGLAARRAADAGPLTVVPCDNMPSNGLLVQRGVLALARYWGPGLEEWIAENISFVSTSVDRITPRTTDPDLMRAAELTGSTDRAAVVTEPFHDWVLSGDFPAGRPPWEAAGARFVDDIEPYERRKLWLLNGSHTLLAYAGTLRGHTTVSEAAADPVCRKWLSEYWSEATHHLAAELDVEAYCRALLHRYDNPRIEHRLAQIGQDGAMKLRVRILPVILAERHAGRTAEASVRALSGWISLLLAGNRPPDSERTAIDAALQNSPDEVVQELLRLLDPALLTDHGLCDEVLRSVAATSPTAG